MRLRQIDQNIGILVKALEFLKQSDLTQETRNLVLALSSEAVNGCNLSSFKSNDTDLVLLTDYFGLRQEDGLNNVKFLKEVLKNNQVSFTDLLLEFFKIKDEEKLDVEGISESKGGLQLTFLTFNLKTGGTSQHSKGKRSH